MFRIERLLIASCNWQLAEFTSPESLLSFAELFYAISSGLSTASSRPPKAQCSRFYWITILWRAINYCK